jgi:nucleoside-diphosphate-sugar epimerase
MTEATRARPADGTPASRALGFDYTPLEDTLRDTYRWMVAHGHVPASQAPRLAS